ncbi:hypothetical protein HDU93_009928, partial [Gonapodya sp. JEL0774]
DLLPTHLHIILSHPYGQPSAHLHTFSAHLLVSLRFRGLRHYMHNWPVLTAIVVSGVFATWNAIIVALLWWGLKGAVKDGSAHKSTFAPAAEMPDGKGKRKALIEDEEDEDIGMESLSGSKGKGPEFLQEPADDDSNPEDVHEEHAVDDHLVPTSVVATSAGYNDEVTVPEVGNDSQVEVKPEFEEAGQDEPEEDSNGSYDVIGRDEGVADPGGEGEGVRRRLTTTRAVTAVV